MFQNVSLVVVGGDVGKLFGKRLLLKFCSASCSLSFSGSSSVKAFVIVVIVDEIGVTKAVLREWLGRLLLLWVHHDYELRSVDRMSERQFSRIDKYR